MSSERCHIWPDHSAPLDECAVCEKLECRDCHTFSGWRGDICGVCLMLGKRPIVATPPIDDWKP